MAIHRLLSHAAGAFGALFVAFEASSLRAQPPIPPPVATASTAPALRRALGLPDLIQLSLERNPALSQAALDIDAAQGRAVQAGRRAAARSHFLSKANNGGKNDRAKTPNVSRSAYSAYLHTHRIGVWQ